jgi:hypothetical protein
VRSQHLLDRTESAAAELPRHRIGAVEIRIDHAHQSNRFALLLELLIDSGVVASEDAHTDHSDGNRIVSLQARTPGGLVASGNNEL